MTLIMWMNKKLFGCALVSLGSVSEMRDLGRQLEDVRSGGDLGPTKGHIKTRL